MNFLTSLPLGPVLLAEGATGGRGSRTLIIQVLLILSILGIAAWLFKKRGAKQLAIRRLIILAFVLFAVIAVIFPEILGIAAAFVGVGRGTDLLLYATVVVLLGFLALQEARTKNQEKRTTYLARRMAIDDAEQPDKVRERSLGIPR
ncbi:DUF2304 domain-containing protein [Dermabacteraceae bacterium P7006]